MTGGAIVDKKCGREPPRMMAAGNCDIVAVERGKVNKEDVLADEPDRPVKWLVMVYMVAQNVPGEASSLLREAADDIREMDSQSVKIGEGGHVRVVYQLHADDIAERKVIGDISPSPVPEGERVVSDGTALSSFVTWAVINAVKAGHVPGRDHTMLVLWGHAYRFSLGAAVTAHGIDAIDFRELADRFRKTQRELYEQLPPEAKAAIPYARDLKLDVLGFDTCDLATIEMAIQMQDFARFMLASQMGMPLPGWPYDDVLARLAEPKGRPMAPAELGSYVVRRFCEHYRAEDRPVALSLLNLAKASPLLELTESLARALALSLDGDEDETALVMQLFQQAQTVTDKPFVDVANLCLNFLRYSGSADVRNAAASLGDFLVTPLEAPTTGHSRSTGGTNRAFVAENGRNACEAGGLQGVSLYAPHVAPETYDWLGANHWYEKFLFTRKTLWYELVRALALPR